jgi:phosphoribosylglycinamide formyltransferase-1
MGALLEAGVPVAAVISNQPDAAGLRLARASGVPTAIVPHTMYSSRELFDRALATEIDRFSPRLIALAGFMRVLTPGFISRYAGRLLNIHPSLLPAFPGLRTHARALATGVRIHGCSVHFVTADLDHGPLVIQAAVPVKRDDQESDLAQRVLRQEHRVFSQAVRWFLDGELQVENGVVRVKDPRARQWLFADE